MTATPARLSVPARAEYARLLRGVADALAAGADLSADTLDDLELAVTEAAGAILGSGDVERLTVEFSLDGRALRCRVAADGGDVTDLTLDPVRSMVLATVADSYEVDATAGAITFTVATG